MTALPGLARASRIAIAFTFAALTGLAAAAPVPDQCVGDCAGDGAVTIDDLITGVNIALGLADVSTCEAFADGEGVVTIAQLIQGVNNALAGCPPPVDTPTVTHTATVPPTGTPTGTVAATATATIVTTVSATPTSSPTALPTGTAQGTITATPTAVPTGTTQATITPTATGVPTGTATAVVTATPTGLPTGTATATGAPGTPTPAMGETPTAADSPTPTGTPTASPMPTATAIPPGEQLAGRAALFSTGLGGVHSIVGALVAILTNDDGAAPLVHGVDPGIAAEACPLGGGTERVCSGADGDPLVLSLVGDHCRLAGWFGGEVEIDGAIDLQAAAHESNTCSTPPHVVSATYAIDTLTTSYRQPGPIEVLNILAAGLSGMITLQVEGADQPCVLGASGAVSLGLSGVLTTRVTDGSGVAVEFQNTQILVDQITFGSDCVPLAWRLTVNGGATFTFVPAGFFEVSEFLVAGVPPPADGLAVSFENFQVVHDASADPLAVSLAGRIVSDCLAGTVDVATGTSLDVPAGQVCPAAGALEVSRGAASATLLYTGGGVTITPAGGSPTIFPSCLDLAETICF